MSRPPRSDATTPLRDRLKLEAMKAPPLRSTYPGVAELRIALQFDATLASQLSPQSFSYFPAAKAFFRYACPCHSCTGEFDISRYVADLAAKPGSQRRTRQVTLQCTGELRLDLKELTACPVGAQVQLCIIPHAETAS